MLLVAAGPSPPEPVLASVELVALRVCDEMEAAIMLPDEEGVGPALTSDAERRLVDRPSLDVSEIDRGDACSAELTISEKI